MSVLQTFFYGELSGYHALCLKSFHDHGHDVVVYAYDETDLPDFCIKKDAGSIVSKDDIFFYKDGGSVSCFANLLRYEMLHKVGGWWIDADVLCLTKAWSDDSDIILGRESESFVNTAVMKWPSGHPLLREAADACWRLRGEAFWGQTGPRFMTWLVGQYGLEDKVREQSAYYAVSHEDWADFFDPAKAQSVLSRASGADGLHLWWEMCRRGGIRPDALPEKGSYLDAVIVQHHAERFFKPAIGARSE